MISDEKMVQDTTNMGSVSIEEEAQKLPDKSRSLRARSIQKRLETERNKNGPKSSLLDRQEKDFSVKTQPSQSKPKTSRCKNRGGGRFGSGSTTMSKYRRKTANAKERDRMKTVNEAFEKLKNVVPVDALLQQEQHNTLLLTKEAEDNGMQCDSMSGEENISNGNILLGLANPLKSTKVTTLRCAISYINSLQKLIEDSEKGVLHPSFYENDEEDKPSDVETLLGQHVALNKDSNNNRDKKKKWNQHKGRKEKRDSKEKKYYNSSKMATAASSLNKTVLLRKMNSKTMTNSSSSCKLSEKDIFDLEKVIKKGSRRKSATAARSMSILNASIPEIMDIIRNATGIDSGSGRNNRKISTKTNAVVKRGNIAKAKKKKGAIVHVQKRTENASHVFGGIIQSNKTFQYDPKNQNILTLPQNNVLQPISSSSQRSPNVFNNVLPYIQPVGENDLKSCNTKRQSLNVDIPQSSYKYQPMKPHHVKTKSSNGFINGASNMSHSNVANKQQLSSSNYQCDNVYIPFPRTNKLTPPQVKKLLSSLTPLTTNPTVVTRSPVSHSTMTVSSISPSSIPMSSTILLSPPPSNSSCSNYSCDETSTTSSFEDVQMDSSSCLISPSNNLLSSSSLHPQTMAHAFPSKISPSIQTASIQSSPSSSSSASENQLNINCPTNSSMDILDDIQQVLKDAENFDFLFA